MAKRTTKTEKAPAADAKSTEYQVVAFKGKDAPGELQRKVESLIAEGWQPAGGLASDGNKICQALTKG